MYKYQVPVEQAGKVTRRIVSATDLLCRLGTRPVHGRWAQLDDVENPNQIWIDTNDLFERFPCIPRDDETDFQSRGVGVRCGSKAGGADRASYVHMLNATLCATGRGICCILENYQTEDGVVVPEVLRPFMGGKDFLPFVRGPPELTKGEKGKKKK